MSKRGRPLFFVVIVITLFFSSHFVSASENNIYKNNLSSTQSSFVESHNFTQTLSNQRSIPYHASLTGMDFAIQDSWRYTPDQSAPGEHFAFDAYMRIDEAADAISPIQQGLRYVTYNNQENLGGYEAALVMRKSGTEERYRVMFSSTWKEILLWSSRGGILAVKSYPFEVGQTYRVLFAKQGNSLKVLVNRAAIIDIYDNTTPVEVDSFSVAAKEGKTYFGPLRAWELGPPRISSKPHQANFSLRAWKGIMWGFDGDEPIFALPGNTAFATEVKLVPGYPAQLALPWYVQNWVDEPFRTDVVVTSTIHEEGGRLSFTLTTKDNAARTDLLNKTKITVSYDAVKNVYLYDHGSELIVPPSSTLRMGAPLDITDPVFYQIVPSASTQGGQWPVTHQWGVYQHANGNYYKQPINHFGWYPGYGTPEWWGAAMHYMKPDRGSWAVIGDDVANPVFEWLESDDRKEFSALMCWWGYDLHWNWMPGDGSVTTLNPGTYTFKWRLTSLPKNEANTRLVSSAYAFPGDLTEKWLVYTGGVGHVEKFDKIVLKASPFGEFIWGESAFQDTTTLGKGDTTTLRFSGPEFVQTTAGDSQFTESFEPNTDYEVSAWVKTEDVQGEGPGIVFGGHSYYPGVTSTRGWQQIGFVTRPNEPLHTVPFSLHLSGAGKAWFDNFLIRPITAENPVTPGLNNAPKPLTAVGVIDSEKLLNWNVGSAATDTAKTVLDLSGHGHHGTRQNVAVETKDGHDVFSFSGNQSQILMRGHESVNFSSSTSLIVWFKPGKGQSGWNVLLSGGPRESDRWRILLSKTDAYYLYAHLPTGVIGNGTQLIEENKWFQIALVDDGTNISLYLNGSLVGNKPSSGFLFGSGSKGYVRLGAMSYGGKIESSYEGDVSQMKILNKALTAAEVVTEFGKGSFAP